MNNEKIKIQTVQLMVEQSVRVEVETDNGMFPQLIPDDFY
jgi:hypothetical protein